MRRLSVVWAFAVTGSVSMLSGAETVSFSIAETCFRGRRFTGVIV